MTGYDLSAWPLFRSVIDDGAPAADKTRRCFFVGPGGDADPDVRRHAETVWKYIVRPALLDTEFTPERLDPAGVGGQPGAPKAAIDAILDDDLVIALLSFRNPDVFYQTAIAQAAARPLILLVEDGQDVGFDPRGAQVMSYSIDTDSILSATHVRRLQALLKAMAAMEPPEQPFRNGAMALNGAATGGAVLHERSRQVTYDQRVAMMREARTRIDIMGLANMALALHPDMLETLRGKSGSGVELRILQCAPSNPGIGSLVNARDAMHLNAVKNEIEAAAEAWRRLIETAEVNLAVTLRRAQTRLPLASALITDQGVVATPYLASRPTSDSPTLTAAGGSAYHRAMQAEFDLVWSEAQTLFRAEPRSAPRPAPANANFMRPEDLPPAAGGLATGGLAADSAPPTANQTTPPSPPRGFASLRGFGR